MFRQSGEWDTIIRTNNKKKSNIKNRLFKSMRARIIFITILVSVIPLIVFNIFIHNTVKSNLIAQKTERLQTHNTILKNYIISENYLETKSSNIINVELAQLAAGYDGHIEIIDSSFNIIKDSYNLDDGKTSVVSDVLKASKGENVSSYNAKEEYLEFALPITVSNTVVDGNDEETEVSTVIGVIYARYSTNDVNTLVSKINVYNYLFDVILLLIVIGIAILVSDSMVKPFKQLEKHVEKIASGRFDERIHIKSYSEVEQICDAFNNMTDKIEQLEDSRQEFVSNVSHELKTPITSMKVLADSLLLQESIPEELYKEFLADIVKEIDRENNIITDLLSLVKMNKENVDLNISSVSINDLLELILKRLRPIAVEKNIELVLESFRPVVADIDEVKFTIAISNLVENAIKYNVMDGWVRVSLNSDQTYFYVKVSDSGIGIPKEDTERIFDRFFRVDKARSRETGGTGLGLAITKSAILMHRGSIKVHSKEGEGTTFTVRVPLKYIP